MYVYLYSVLCTIKIIKMTKKFLILLPPLNKYRDDSFWKFDLFDVKSSKHIYKFDTH